MQYPGIIDRNTRNRPRIRKHQLKRGSQLLTASLAHENQTLKFGNRQLSHQKISFSYTYFYLKIMAATPFCTGEFPEDYDYLAPDGSEIRLLPKNKPFKGENGGLEGRELVHCTLPSGSVSQTVKHKLVEEIWYFLSGEGTVWRKQGNHEDEIAVSNGTGLIIPSGVHFQFRNQGEKPLQFLIATMPPWLRADEAISVNNRW